MAKTITVSNATQLTAALARAGAGDTILLAGGDYGKLAIGTKAAFGQGFTSPVTIAAADLKNPPDFSGLDLRGVSNLSFKDVTFDYTYKLGDATSLRPFTVSGGSNISFNGCTFDGDVARGLSSVADGFGSGVGLAVRDSTGVTVQNSEFYGFWKGAVISNSNNVLVSGNDVHSMRMDGLCFSAVQGAVVEKNHIHDFIGSPTSKDHCDMIQVWTDGTTRPTTDLVIRGNTLDIGTGTATQSIWMRNEEVDTGQAGTEMFYRRVTIENNVIVNGHTHGIAVGEATGLIIRNNSVLHADGEAADGADPALEIPRIWVATRSTSVTVQQNATGGIQGFEGQAGWTIKNNAIIQDQNAFGENYYGNIFIASSLQTVDGEHRFIALPGSILDKLDAGALATLTLPTSLTLDANFHVTAPVIGGQERTFDASLTLGPQPAGTTYLWSFGDGTTATGKTVSHAYDTGGFYDVRLTVRLPDGRTDSQSLNIGVEGRDLVRMDDHGAFLVYSQGQPQLLSSLTTSAATTFDGLQLGGAGTAASVPRAAVATMLATDDVTISLTLDADRAGAAGEVMRLHGAFILGIDAKGGVVLQATSSLGQTVKMVASDVGVNDTRDHDIQIRLDDGRLELWVDGTMRTDTAFAGTFANSSRHDLMFGNPWTDRNFFGDLKEFSIVVNDGPGDGVDVTVTDAADAGAMLFAADAGLYDGSAATTTDAFTAAHTIDLSGPLL